MKSASVLIIDKGRFVLFRDRETHLYSDCGGGMEKGKLCMIQQQENF